MIKASEIRTMDKADLSKEIAAKKMEYVKAKMSTVSGNSKETHKLKTLRKEIARLQTVKNENK
jgi:ribosomal protein L29